MSSGGRALRRFGRCAILAQQRAVSPGAGSAPQGPGAMTDKEDERGVRAAVTLHMRLDEPLGAVCVPSWLDTINRVSKTVDPRLFDQALQHMPMSQNVEDRRGERYPRRWAVKPQYRAAGDAQ